MKNNADESHTTIWSLQNPSLEEGWIVGRVQFKDLSVDTEPEYQVRED